MEKTLYIIFSLIIFYSCNYRTARMGENSVEIIPVDIDSKNSSNASEFIEKIEIIPLQTDIDNLLSTYQKMTYNKDLEQYIVLNNDMTVYLFSKDGTFMANSKLVKGRGPGEYLTIVDAVYNSFSKAIELLDPYGTIYRYDVSFQFIEKIGLNQRNIIFSRFVPMNADQYILTSVVIGSKDAVIYFCDYKDETINKTISYENGYIATIAMNHNLFFTEKNNLYFSPIGLDYNFYQVDFESQDLTSIMQLDFGNKTVDKKEIKKMFGDFSESFGKQKKIEINQKQMDEINNFLKNSSYPLPIIKFFNEHYIYVYLLSDHKRSTFIYNRKTEKYFLHTSDDSFKLYFCLDIEENVLIAMAQAYELEKYIDKQFMDSENLLRLSMIKEDDNPVVIKYHLR